MSNIQLYNQDCLKVLKEIPDKAFDLILQDTPFGVTQNKWDIKPDLNTMWPQWARIAKDNCPIIFFATQPFASELITSNPSLFRYDLIWYKPLGSGFLNSAKMPMRNHEHLLVFYKKPSTYNPQMGIGIRKSGNRKNDRNSTNYGKFSTGGTFKFDDKGLRYPQSVLDFTNGDRTTENEHPTQKPLALIRYLVKSYSNEGDNVFDGYFGSGTTPLACQIENRNGIFCEIDKDYFEAAKKRLEIYVGTKGQSLFTSPQEQYKQTEI